MNKCPFCGADDMNDTESQLLSRKRQRIAKLKSLLTEVEAFSQDVYKHPLPEAGGSYIWDLHRQAEIILAKLKEARRNP